MWLSSAYSRKSVTYVLYHLAAKPEWIQVLRDEIEPIVAADGWTKAALGKMRKLDSLFRESQRYNGIAIRTSHSAHIPLRTY